MDISPSTRRLSFLSDLSHGSTDRQLKAPEVVTLGVIVGFSSVLPDLFGLEEHNLRLCLSRPDVNMFMNRKRGGLSERSKVICSAYMSR